MFKADEDFYNFLSSDTSQMSNYLRSKLLIKQKEMGLFNIYTEDGFVKIQTEIMSAIFSSKFPEFLCTYNELFDNLFTSMKSIKSLTSMLSFLYSHLGSILLKLDIINKRVLGLNGRDFNIEETGKGLRHLSNYFE